MQNQVNISPINNFTQLLKAAELSRSKEIKIPIEQARLMSLTLIDLLNKVNQNYEDLLYELKKSNETQVVDVTMDGGTFED